MSEKIEKETARGRGDLVRKQGEEELGRGLKRGEEKEDRTFGNG